MIPISDVCSATSVVIVFEISTSADSRASKVITSKNVEKFWKVDLPGQSPAARTWGRSVNPVKPGTAASVRRIAAIVAPTAAGRVSPRLKYSSS